MYFFARLRIDLQMSIFGLSHKLLIFRIYHREYVKSARYTPLSWCSEDLNFSVFMHLFCVFPRYGILKKYMQITENIFFMNSNFFQSRWIEACSNLLETHSAKKTMEKFGCLCHLWNLLDYWWTVFKIKSDCKFIIFFNLEL